MSTNPTSSLGMQNWYASTLSQSCGSTDTTLYITVVPSITEGYLVIDPNNTSTREVVHFTSVGAGTISIPTTGDRGLDGTSAQTHAQGTDVELHYTTSYFTALQNNYATRNASIVPSLLATGAQSATVAASETTTSTSYTTSGFTTLAVTVTIGANGLLLVGFGASQTSNNTSDAMTWMSPALSGANTVAAADGNAAHWQSSSGNLEESVSRTILLTGLATGSTVVTMNYRVQTGGSGAGTGTWVNRNLFAVPL